jgi:Domain of unknown function (DUF4034)
MFHSIYPAQATALTAPQPPSRETPVIDIGADPDPGFGHAIGRHGQRLLDIRDHAALTAYYRTLSGDGRCLLLEAVARHLPNIDQLEQWALADTGNAVAQLLAGAAYSHKAWEARGGRLANEVGGSQWQLFGMWLKQASGYLQAAIRLDPHQAEPYYRMMAVLIGDSSLSDRSLRTFFDLAIERHPGHLLAHMDMLTSLTAKWGGSHEQMFAFAEAAVAKAGPDSILHALRPMAAIERMVAFIIDKDYDGGNAYLRSKDVQARMQACYAMVQGGALEGHPFAPVFYNWLAATLIYGHAAEGKKECLELMGDRITARPWAYISMPVIALVNDLRDDFKLFRL